MENVKNFINKYGKWVVILAVAVLAAITIKQCDSINKYKSEKARLENNLLAVNDTLKNYKEGKYNIAEMRAMQLRIDELADSLKLERGKSPITIIKYVASLSDSMSLPVTVLHDTVYIDKAWSDMGFLDASESAEFGNSSRSIYVRIPYKVNCETGMLESNGNADVDLSQNIWVESMLYRDKKGYTYIKLKTDYPACTFNNGAGILVADKSYDYKNRKQFGLGIGLQVGYGAALSRPVKLTPYVGVGVSLNWNPRFLQF